MPLVSPNAAWHSTTPLANPSRVPAAVRPSCDSGTPPIILLPPLIPTLLFPPPCESRLPLHPDPWRWSPLKVHRRLQQGMLVPHPPSLLSPSCPSRPSPLPGPRPRLRSPSRPPLCVWRVAGGRPVPLLRLLLLPGGQPVGLLRAHALRAVLHGGRGRGGQHHGGGGDGAPAASSQRDAGGRGGVRTR